MTPCTPSNPSPSTIDSQRFDNVIDCWTDEVVGLDVTWAERVHPTYSLAFSKSIRGQSLRHYLDYRADWNLLGLYVYLPIDTARVKRAALDLSINEVNVQVAFGSFHASADDNYVRYQIAIPTEGLRITTRFLSALVTNAETALDQHIPTILKGTSKIAIERESAVEAIS